MLLVGCNQHNALMTFSDIQQGGKAWGSFTLLRLSSPLGPEQTSLVNSRPRSNMLVSWSQHSGKCVDDGKPAPEEIASVSSADALLIRAASEVCDPTAASDWKASGSHFGSLLKICDETGFQCHAVLNLKDSKGNKNQPLRRPFFFHIILVNTGKYVDVYLTSPEA